MKQFTITLYIGLAIAWATSAYSYPGPTVNDRNVISVYTPSFFKKNYVTIPKEINIQTFVLNDVVLNKNGVQISEDLIKKYVWRTITKGQKIDIKELKQNLNNINSLAGVAAKATLKKINDSTFDLVIDLKNTKAVKAAVRADNSGSKTTSYNKTTSSLSFANPFNLGETIGFRQTHTMANGTNYYELNNKFFVGDDGSSVAFRAATMRYEHSDYARPQKLEGNSNFFDLNYLKPVFYDDNMNTKMGIGIFRGGFHTFKNSGATEEEDTVNERLDLSLHLNFQDTAFNKANTNARIILSTGRTNLSNSAIDLNKSDDPAGVQGRYTKINPAFSRREKINDKNDLIIKFKGQYAFNNLDGNEEFSLGGTYNVRSYPNNESGGDSGFIFTTELEHKVNKDLKTSLVFDYGKIRTVMDPHSGWQPFGYASQKNEYSLASWGVVADWKIVPGSTIKAQLINRIGSNNQRSSNSKGMDYDRTKHETKLLLSFTQDF
jgi:hemolysin activation/secretion protein